jgi:Holliday junction resolvasome RuvABC endonuclease subunit
VTAPRVIGLDLSITATGIADHTGATRCVGGKADRGDQRIVDIATEISAVCDGADLVVIEDLAVHGPGNGMAAAQVMGAVKATLLRTTTPYALVPPSSLKKYATGKGTAGKPDMAVALYKRAGLELGDDNQVDAWWLRAMGMHNCGAPVVDVPTEQRRVLERITWPAVRHDR